MKSRNLRLNKITLLALAAMFFTSFAQAQIARVQVIHNAPDPAASTVDVWLTAGGVSTLLVDDFQFRTATPFIDAPAGVGIQVGIAPGNSTSVNDTIANYNYTLTSGETYVIVAAGVLTPSNFANNPDGISTAFQLAVNAMGQESAMMGMTDFAVFHGAPDAPYVDVAAQGVATLVDDAPYGGFTGYTSVPSDLYILDVSDSSATSVVTTKTAELSGLGGGAAVVFASGFLVPSANQNGPAFGIFAALPDGSVVEFPTVARAQVIHNAPDPAASIVDVYYTASGNSVLLLDNFAFRTATPFVDIASEIPVSIGIAPGNSNSVADTIANFDYNLAESGAYSIIATGVLDPSMFQANPDNISTAFGLLVNPMAQEASTNTDVDFFVVHGTTDAPTIDVRVKGGATLVDDAPFRAFTPYINVPAASYTLEVTTADQSAVVATYEADLSTLGGGAATVFASGFLTPNDDQNGEPFGLFAALGNGMVIPFSLITNIEEDLTTTQNGVQLFPNPAENTLNVIADLKPGTSTSLKMYDIQGRMVRHFGNQKLTTSATALDVSELDTGIFFLEIEFDNGTTIREKVVIR